MRKQIEICTCDICHKERDVQEVTYPVLLITDQTEGRNTTPYISYEKIDMCAECQRKAINVKGWGAQGYNTYNFIHNIEVKDGKDDI